jgi:CRISPR-associated protein Csb1
MTQLDKFDNIIQDDTIAAIVMRQHLKPVEGETPTVIFPPTYAGIGYNIDTLDQNGEIKNVCTIDSVGSQANRMEPIFKKTEYKDLVPQITVEIRKPPAKGQEQGELIDTVNLLDAGHRIADAVARFSDKANEINKAFNAIKNGNAIPLAKLSPTSIVFGCWDSRGTSVKLPRIVRSTIKAFNVSKLTRAAQYVPATEHYEEAFERLSDKERKKFADAGMGHVPSTGAPGGVLLDSKSEVIKETVVSLSPLRSLQTGDDSTAIKLRSYIFGLSLVAITAPQEPMLRMGCELTADPEKPVSWEIVYCDGTRKSFTISHDDALKFAQDAKNAFGIGESQTFVFDSKKANEALKKEKEKKGEEE